MLCLFLRGIVFIFHCIFSSFPFFLLFLSWFPELIAFHKCKSRTTSCFTIGFQFLLRNIRTTPKTLKIRCDWDLDLLAKQDHLRMNLAPNSNIHLKSIENLDRTKLPGQMQYVWLPLVWETHRATAWSHMSERAKLSTCPTIDFQEDQKLI